MSFHLSLYLCMLQSLLIWARKTNLADFSDAEISNTPSFHKTWLYWRGCISERVRADPLVTGSGLFLQKIPTQICFSLHPSAVHICRLHSTSMNSQAREQTMHGHKNAQETLVCLQNRGGNFTSLLRSSRTSTNFAGNHPIRNRIRKIAEA